MVAGAGSLLLSSISIMLVQLGYAAVTSRLLSPGAFGAYAVALAGVGLIGMLGGSGFGQAAARSTTAQSDGQLAGAALLAGLSAGAIACVLAVPWAHLWGDPSAVALMCALALAIPLQSVSAVWAGIMRREGMTSYVALVAAVSQAVGLAVGLLAVTITRTPVALTVAQVTAAAVGAVWFGVKVKAPLEWVRTSGGSRRDLLYGFHSSGLSMLRYVAGIAPAWSLSRFLGPAALGSYNRAVTLVTVPLEAIQRSASVALFPELRPNGPIYRKEGAFTDIVVLMTWVVVVGSPAAVFLASPFLEILLGPGWEAAQSIAPWAALMGILPFVSVPLAAALEAVGRYRPLVIAVATQAFFAGAGIAATASTGSITPVPAAVTAGVFSCTLIYLVACSRAALLDFRSWADAVWPVAIVQLPIVAAMWLASASFDSPWKSIAAVMAVFVTEGVLLFLLRRRMSAAPILVKYGLLPERWA